MRAILLLTISGFFFSCSTDSKSNIREKLKDPVGQDKNLVSVKPPLDSGLFIFDSTTGLCWMKQDFSFAKKRFLNAWEEIFAWQNEMNSVSYGGFSDWIIPSISQYRTINKSRQDRIFYRKQFAELDTICVWGKGPFSFWSSNTPNENTASYISFHDGFAISGSRSKQFSSIYSSWKGVELGMSVRLVRVIK